MLADFAKWIRNNALVPPGWSAAPAMNECYLSRDLAKEIDIPQRGILSRTLYDDSDAKVVLFGFSAGHELSAHSAPMPANLYFLEGEADLTLGTDTQLVRAGAFAHMPPHLNHAIVARTPLVMLLVMMKGLKRENKPPGE